MSASPAVRSTTAASWARPRRGWARQPAGRVRVGADNGPWVSPNDKDKYNGVVRYSQGNSRNGVSLTFLGFPNHWHSTDQIPQRAVDSGLIDRFGFIEETDGGETFRYSGAFDWQRSRHERLDSRSPATCSATASSSFTTSRTSSTIRKTATSSSSSRERWTTGAKLTHRRLDALRREATRERRSAWTSGTIRSAGRSDCTDPRQRAAGDRARRRRQPDVGRGVRRVRNRMEPHSADDVRTARRRLPLERHLRQSAQLRRRDTRRHSQSEGLGSVRSVERHRVLRQLGPGLPLELRPGRRAAGRSGDGRSGELRRRPSRARRAPSSASAPWRCAGLQTTATSLVPRLRLGVDLRRRFRQHRGRAGEPPDGRRDHQLHLPEPVAGGGPGPVVLARALSRRAGGRGLRSRRAQPRDLGQVSR